MLEAESEDAGAVGLTGKQFIVLERQEGTRHAIPWIPPLTAEAAEDSSDGAVLAFHGSTEGNS